MAYQQIPEEIWTAARTEYITSNVSQRQICEKYRLSARQVAERSVGERWKEKRDKYRIAIAEKTVEKIANKKAKELADKLSPLRRTADALTAACERISQDAVQFNRHIITRGIGPGMTDTEEVIMQKADTKAIKDMTSALKDLTAAVRNLYEIPTDAEREARSIALDRLQMDKAKAEKEQENTDEKIVVSFADGLDELSE